tara:strand:+ start:3136 stop:3303 length:168 start_codon:yes stop_codon:yes gene_type:complete
MGKLVSECCGANAYFSLGSAHGIYNSSGTYLGICSDCKDHAMFQDITEEELINAK